MDTKILNQAAELLRSGKIVAFPTETVYGLGASIFSQEGIERIFAAKGRPRDNPLIAHVASLEMALSISRDLPPSFYLLAARFFPGPLTLVVHRHPDVPDSVSAGLDTIAIRFPSHPVALELIRRVGHPLVAPSANLSGKPSGTIAEDVREDLDGRIDAIIDGGPCSIGIESTVLDLVSFEHPTILRPGQITQAELAEFLQEEVLLYTSGPKASPGMRYRHYAPNTPVKVVSYFTGGDSCKRMLIADRPMEGALPLHPATLYALMRQADREGFDEIVIVCDEKGDAALLNRIGKML